MNISKAVHPENTTRVYIRVEYIHIVKGVSKYCEKCPIALAYASKLPRATCIYVMPKRQACMVGRNSYLLVTGKKAAKRIENFIKAFDKNQPVKPFSFYAIVPTEAL